MQPRQMRETVTPVAPRGVNFMGSKVGIRVVRGQCGRRGTCAGFLPPTRTPHGGGR